MNCVVYESMAFMNVSRNKDQLDVMKEERHYDTGPYFGFINFDMNKYAIYEFILVIFILMAFVLNVTFIGYCAVVRFRDLDYSFVRNIRRKNGKKVIYTQTASECSDDDTSLENVFESNDS